MPESESAPTSTTIPIIRKTDRVDSPTMYATWRDYAFSDDAEIAPTPHN